MITQQQLKDLTCVAAFLAMAERENMMLNGHTGNEAFEAFARIICVRPFDLRVLARDPAVDRLMKQA